MSGTIVDVPGITVGHDEDFGALTGCTVVLFGEHGAVAGVDVRGGAPGTRETDLLSPLSSPERIHAICLTGGSAYGLDAAGGVMRALEERGIGYRVRNVVVPLVPSAVIFDLGIGDHQRRPDQAMGYRAVARASSDPPAEGNAGAGCGATVGKVLGLDRAMKSGIGSASATNGEGVVVGAIVVVNAVGSVVDPQTGKVIAGPRNDAGLPIDAASFLREQPWRREAPSANTTIGVIATNAALTKAQATKVAQMAHDGLARTISPTHTSLDGDTLFAASVGTIHTGLDVVGALAIEAVTGAVVRAVTQARGAGGLPAYRDLT